MRRREGEGLWRDTGEGAEERRRERAGMREEAGTKGERAIRWLIGKKKKKKNNGDAGVQVSAGRDVLLLPGNPVSVVGDIARKKKGREGKERKVPPRSG